MPCNSSGSMVGTVEVCRWWVYILSLLVHVLKYSNDFISTSSSEHSIDTCESKVLVPIFGLQLLMVPHLPALNSVQVLV